MNRLAPVVREGKWIDIGHDSKIKLSGRSLLHCYEGKTTRHGLEWLIHDRPLLNWVLSKNPIDVSCPPL